MKKLTENTLAARLYALFASLLILSLCVSPLFAGINALAAEAPEADPGSSSELSQTAYPQDTDETYMDLLRDSGILSDTDARMLRFAADRMRINPDNRYDDLYFDTWSVLMRVHRNRSIDITENFDVYFNEEMHGMTRTLPSYSSAEAFEIRDMRVVGSPYHTSSDTIYIGSADQTVTGLQHYTIQYTIANFDDSYDGYDRLYRDIVGSDVDYPVYNVCGAVILDEGMTFDEVTIYSGRYGYTENEYIEYLSSGNQLLVYNTKELGSNNAVTVDAKLPEGAYSEPALLQPDYIVDKMVVNASIDEYGKMHVDEEYDIELLNDYVTSFYRNLITYCSVESTVKNLTLTKNGETPVSTKGSTVSCSLDPSDGTEAHIKISYDMNYLICSGQSDYPLAFPVITYDGTMCKYRNVEFNLDTPFDLSEQLQYFGIYTGNYSNLSSYSESVKDAKYYFTDNVGGKSIQSVLSGSDMPIGETATMEVAFSKDALRRKTLVTDYILSILGLGGVGALLASLFAKKSSEKQLTPSVQYYPPAGLNPAEVGYIIDNECEDRDVTSLIYYWASKGFLTIEVPKKNSSGFVLHKIAPLSNDHRDYEKDLFNKMFRLGTGDSVKDSQLSRKLYSDVSTAASKVTNVFTGSQRFFTSRSSALASLLPIAVPALVWLGALAASRLWGYQDGASSSLLVGGVISFFASRSIKTGLIRKHKEGAGKSVFRIIMRAVLIGLAVLFMFSSGGGSVSYITGGILGALVLVNTLVAPRLLKRTDFYTDLLGLVVGFKEFLTTAEKDRLKMLLDENPSYYYDILPYAQVLGVSKQWLSRFDGLTMQSPSWFYGPYVSPYTLNTMLNSNMTRMNNSMTSVPASSGGGGGFSGGSFGGGFSGGGGGFSGGGGGGGAGGW